MEIIRQTKTTPELFSFYKHQLDKYPEFLRSLIFQDIKKFSSNLSFLMTQPELEGLLVYRYRQLRSTSMVSIENLIYTKPDVINDLLNEVIIISKNKRGIITELIPRDRNLIPILNDLKFKKTLNWFGTPTTKLINKFSPSSSIELVRYTKQTHHAFKSVFTKFLTAHDEFNNRSFNIASDHKIYPVRLNNRVHQIKLSYFIERMIKDPNWFTYIIMDDGNPDGAPIGFIKGLRVRSNNSLFINFYLPDKYNQYTGECFYKFCRYVNRNKVSNIGMIVSEADKSGMSTMSKWFGDPLGSQYIRFT